MTTNLDPNFVSGTSTEAPVSSTQPESSSNSPAVGAMIVETLQEQTVAQLQLMSSALQAGDPVNLPLPPIPGFSPSQVPVPNSSAAYTYDGKGYVDQLEKLFQDAYYGSGDPAAMARLLTFYARLSKEGLVTPEVKELLDKVNFTQFIDSAMQEMALYALFYGYGNPPVNGQAGVTALIHGMSAYLNQEFPGSTDAFITEMKNDLAAGYDSLVAAHTNAQGQLYWDNGGYTDPTTGQTVLVHYTWPSDKDMISILINNSGMTGIPNNYWKDFDWASFRQDCRTQGLDTLLKKYKDPLIAVTLWFVMMTDQDNQGKLGNLGDATTLLTDMTNKYASRLASLASQMGSPNFNGDQALEFAKLFYGASNSIQAQLPLAPIADSWKTNVTNAIGGIQVTVNGTKMPLGIAMAKALNGEISKDDLASAMRGLIPNTPTPPPPPAPTNSADYYRNGLRDYFSSIGIFGGMFGRSPTQQEVVSAVTSVLPNPPSSITYENYQALVQGINEADSIGGYRTLDNYTMTDALHALVPNPPTSPSVDPTTPSTDAPDYNALLTAVQQGGTLLTNQSKTLATQVTAVSNIINIALKLGGTMVTKSGGGIIDLLDSTVRNQRPG